jgi:hypothetical protein
MGTEIVFVLIYPIALICLPAAIWFWSYAAKVDHPSRIELAKAYVPLLVGFAVSMSGMALLTYTECEADFTSLVHDGYYTEAQRPVYLPGRIEGQVILNLVFVLPLICCGVIPWTARLVSTGRLRLGGIAIRAMIGWLVLSFIGWLFNLGFIVPPYPLLHSLTSAVISVLIYGLPVPLAALWLSHRNWIWNSTAS